MPDDKSPTHANLGWKPTLLLLSLCPLHTVVMIEAQWLGYWCSYVFASLIVLHLWFYYHFYQVRYRARPYLTAAILEYPVTMIFAYSIPLYVSFYYLIAFPHHSLDASLVTDNRDLIAWLSHSVLGVPAQLDPGDTADAMIIYVFSMIIFFSVLCTLLSVPLWWQASHNWKDIFLKLKKTSGILLLLLFVIVLMDSAVSYWVRTDYGFQPVSIIVATGMKDYSNAHFVPSFLNGQAFEWTWRPNVISFCASGTVGFLRYLVRNINYRGK